MHDAAITAFADHLVPEAFSRRHTAGRVDVVTDVPSGTAAFTDWVTARVAEAVTDRDPTGLRPVRFVVVEGGDGVRLRWDESPCCEPAWLAARVRDEVGGTATPWVFAVELGEPGADDVWRATWYAEGRGRGVAQVHAGTVDMRWDRTADTDTVLTQQAVPWRASAVAAYHRVLHGHPARAAHHLRRT